MRMPISKYLIYLCQNRDNGPNYIYNTPNLDFHFECLSLLYGWDFYFYFDDDDEEDEEDWSLLYILIYDSFNMEHSMPIPRRYEHCHHRKVSTFSLLCIGILSRVLVWENFYY